MVSLFLERHRYGVTALRQFRFYFTQKQKYLRYNKYEYKIKKIFINSLSK